MAKQSVQGMILSLVQEVREDVKKLTTETVPSIQKAVAVAEAKAKAEAKSTARFHALIWGSLTTVISLAGLAVAYFK